MDAVELPLPVEVAPPPKLTGSDNFRTPSMVATHSNSIHSSLIQNGTISITNYPFPLNFFIKFSFFACYSSFLAPIIIFHRLLLLISLPLGFSCLDLCYFVVWLVVANPWPFWTNLVKFLKLENCNCLGKIGFTIAFFCFCIFIYSGNILCVGCSWLHHCLTWKWTCWFTTVPIAAAADFFFPCQYPFFR